MTNEEVMLCQLRRHRRRSGESELNLAQAVQITAYEMHMAPAAAEGHEESSTTGSPASSTSSLQALRPSRDSSATGRRL